MLFWSLILHYCQHFVGLLSDSSLLPTFCWFTVWFFIIVNILLICCLILHYYQYFVTLVADSSLLSIFYYSGHWFFIIFNILLLLPLILHYCQHFVYLLSDSSLLSIFRSSIDWFLNTVNILFYCLVLQYCQHFVTLPTDSSILSAFCYFTDWFLKRNIWKIKSSTETADGHEHCCELLLDMSVGVTHFLRPVLPRVTPVFVHWKPSTEAVIPACFTYVVLRNAHAGSSLELLDCMRAREQ